MNPWSEGGTDALLLADPERAIGFGALGVSLDVFFGWFHVWCGKR